MTNVENFRALMTEFGVLIKNDIEIGQTGYLDKPQLGRLFTGIDKLGRVFVNLPVSFTRYNEGVAEKGTTAFVVFQRYVENQELFVVGGEPSPITSDKFLEANTLHNLEMLLSGDTLRFCHIKGRTISLDPIRDQKNYILIQLLGGPAD